MEKKQKTFALVLSRERWCPSGVCCSLGLITLNVNIDGEGNACVSRYYRNRPQGSNRLFSDICSGASDLIEAVLSYLKAYSQLVFCHKFIL